MLYDISKGQSVNERQMPLKYMPFDSLFLRGLRKRNINGHLQTLSYNTVFRVFLKDSFEIKRKCY